MPLFDLHCDTLTECVRKGESLYSNSLHWDVSRGRAFGARTQVLAVWTPDTLRGDAAFRAAETAIQLAYDAQAQYAPALRLWQKQQPFFDESGDACVGILALESAAALGGSLVRLEELLQKGVKVVTLTWNGDNEVASGVEGDASRGLTAFGKDVIRVMEREKAVSDVSHLNERGFWDVCAWSDRPFIASHSVSKAVFDHRRNLTDAQFDEIVRRGGLVGLNLCAAQLGEQSFDRWERHLAHFLERGGENHLALGLDLDGTTLPDAWNGIDVYAALFRYLQRRGYAESLLSALFYENARKFFKKNEKM